MTKPRLPVGLRAGGKLLWRALAGDEMPEPLVVLLTEACRARDRLDQLDRLLRGDAEMWLELVHKTRTDSYELHVDHALAQANTTAGVLQNLLAKIPAPAAKGASSGASSNGQPTTAVDQLAARRKRGPAPSGGDGKSTRTRTAERRRPKSE